MKNRTIIGIGCIVLALLITFVIAPLVNKAADSRVDILRLTKDITQGHKITDADLETVTVGSYNLPADVLTDMESVVGKYAACDMVTGDYLLPDKLDGDQVAMSITIPSFAGGLSGKLENGDIVSLIVYVDEDGEEVTVIPKALTYVRVITSTTADGIDKDELVQNEDGTYELPTTLTLLVDPLQAKLLAEYENNSKIHAVLVSRGDEKKAKAFLKEQKTMLEEIAEEEAEKEAEGDDNG